MKLSPDDPAILPRQRWYLLPVALFAVCVIGGMLWIVLTVARVGQGGLLFVAPGAVEFDVIQPGRYQLWNETDAIVAGTRYTAPVAIPPLIQFRITELRTGRRHPLLVPALTVREAQGGPLRASVGTFDAPAPGRYEVRIAGPFPPRVFNVTRAGRDLMLAFIGGGLLCAVGGIAAPLIAFAILTRRGRARRTLYGPDC